MRAKQIFNPSTKNAKSGAILQTLILDSWKSKFHVITPDCMVPTVHVDPKVSQPIEMAVTLKTKDLVLPGGAHSYSIARK